MAEQAQDQEFVTPAEVARRLRVAQGTVMAWVREGRLPAVRVGRKVVRIRRKDFEKLLGGAG